MLSQSPSVYSSFYIGQASLPLVAASQIHNDQDLRLASEH